MSIESARQLYVDLLEDSALADAVYGLDDPDARWEHLSERGYDFTQEEWLDVSREVNGFVDQARDLSDDDLKDVVGGLTHSIAWLPITLRTQLLKVGPPPIRAMYGVTRPGGGGS